MSKIPTELVKSWDAKQGIVRTVRFNGLLFSEKVIFK